MSVIQIFSYCSGIGVDLAAHLGATVSVGDTDQVITGVAPLAGGETLLKALSRQQIVSLRLLSLLLQQLILRPKLLRLLN